MNISVHSSVLVIGNGEAAQVVVETLSVHPVTWIKESARVVEVSGQRGNFRVKVVQRETGNVEWIDAGAIVLALEPKAGLDPGFPRTEWIQPIAKAKHWFSAGPQDYAFYLRDLDNEHTFSRALDQALRLRSQGAGVYVFYSNLKLGTLEHEESYQRCLHAGVKFWRVNNPLTIRTEEKGLRLGYYDPFLNLEFEQTVSTLFVGEIFTPSSELVRLQNKFKLKSSSIFNYPPGANRPGIFVIHEAVVSGVAVEEAAVAVAGEIAPLREGELSITDTFPIIDPERCSLCSTCSQVCPAGAVELDRNHSRVMLDPLACQACGICVSACPKGAVSFPLFNRALVYEHLRKNSKNKVLVFACQNSGAVALRKTTLPSKMAAKVELMIVPCACALDHSYLVEGWLHGAERLILATCPPGSCASHKEHRTGDIQRILQEMGAKPQLVHIIAVAANSPALWQQELNQVLRTYTNQEVS